MSQPRHIATIEKNRAEQIQVSLTTYNGHELVDVRVFADFDGSGGEPRATKKGISLARSKLPELIAALQAAEREASR